MNTHEQFIELPTAKLAKQAGFYWECNERYLHEKQKSIIFAAENQHRNSTDP